MRRSALLFVAALLLAATATPQPTQPATAGATQASATQASATAPAKTTAKKTSAKPAKMSNDECLACHSDAGLTKDVNGKTVSLHVDGDKFKASIHSSFGCTDCHADIKAFPHDPAPAMPKCSTCHADEQIAYDHGVHAKAAAAGNANVPKCQDCHGSVHELLPSSDPRS
jgi:hypothetical protein